MKVLFEFHPSEFSLASLGRAAALDGGRKPGIHKIGGGWTGCIASDTKLPDNESSMSTTLGLETLGVGRDVGCSWSLAGGQVELRPAGLGGRAEFRARPSTPGITCYIPEQSFVETGSRTPTHGGRSNSRARKGASQTNSQCRVSRRSLLKRESTHARLPACLWLWLARALRSPKMT